MLKLLTKIQSVLQRKHMASLLADQLYSIELRNIYKHKLRIDVGLYTYGCFNSHRFNPNITFGRYCSGSTSTSRLGRNHPLH